MTGPASPDTRVVSISSLFPDDGTGGVVSTPPEVLDGVVPIESLLYDPDAALRGALALEPELERLLTEADAKLQETVNQLLDLLRLAAKGRGAGS